MNGRPITLRYPGTCSECGARLTKGAVANWHGRGKVSGIGCHDGSCKACSGRGATWRGVPCRSCDGTGAKLASTDPNELHPAPVKVGDRVDGLGVVQAIDDGGRLLMVDGKWARRTSRGWRHGHENTGQRCEDAPCCGCCS